MKKIMFNDSYLLTSLVLSGCKTMTRRSESGIKINPKASSEAVKYAVDMHKAVRAGKSCIKLDDEIAISIQTRYQIGEELAIAESYKSLLEKSLPLDLPLDLERKLQKLVEQGHPGSSNKMYVSPELMPHRIRITDFKVERQKDISDEDCMKEGIRKVLDKFFYFEGYEAGIKECPCGNYLDTPQEAFAQLVNKAMGKNTWERNAWVVAYEFELVK